MVLSTIGGISLWSVVVVLPAVQAEFGVDRATASLPYTLTMVGFALGGVMMGRMADRCGIMLAGADRRRCTQLGLCRGGSMRAACGSSRLRMVC